MAISLFFVCILFMAVMFMQFKTIDETDITAIENMRETELREAISTWKAKYEELEQKIVDKGEFYTNLRYIYLFARKLNVFRKEQYEFLGLYKLIDYDNKNKTRIWEKQELPHNTVPLNEDEIIKVIKGIENK